MTEPRTSEPRMTEEPVTERRTSGRRCVFLDRDGVINVKQPEGCYVESWEQFTFLPNVADWIQLFNVLGYLVIVVTNQRGIAKGLYTEDDLAEIHGRMVASLAERGARIDDVFFCPHDNGQCDCRKPSPGMIYAARERWQINLAGSIIIGDSDCDRDLAAACDLPFVRVQAGQIVRPVA